MPFNIASYALLTHMLAQQCDMDVGDFIWTGGDCHIYSNHTEQVELQLSRQPFPYPVLNIKRKPASIFDYEYEDFEVLEYQHHPAIKAPLQYDLCQPQTGRAQPDCGRGPQWRHRQRQRSALARIG